MDRWFPMTLDYTRSVPTETRRAETANFAAVRSAFRALQNPPLVHLV
jgi:hypothetical protein